MLFLGTAHHVASSAPSLHGLHRQSCDLKTKGARKKHIVDGEITIYFIKRLLKPRRRRRGGTLNDDEGEEEEAGG